MARQTSSDPLPYVQIDRAVKPKVSILADAMGVPRQHALGSLVEWWDLCGDPRVLEKIIANTPKGKEPALLLSEDDVELFFQLASGHTVAVKTLTAIGLLERMDEDQFRVRGMSRYFAPIKARMQMLKGAEAGGKASVDARRRKTGTAQPGRSGERSEDPSSQPSKSLQEGFESASNRIRTHPEPSSEPPRTGDRRPPNSSVHSTAYRDLIKEGETVPVPPAPLELIPTLASEPKPQKLKEKKKPDPDAEFERFKNACTADEARVFGVWCSTFGVEIGADWGLKKLVGEKLKAHSADELCAAIRGHARDPFLAKNPTLRSIFRDASHIAICAKRGAA